MSQNNIAKKSTSADKTSIGFDYQFLYFILLLLNLEKDEKIGYEVKDDIHIELNDGKGIWMQLKHTLRTASDGKPVNLTEKDIDVWKTLYNWCLEIEKTDNDADSIKLIENTRFILISNKSTNTNNLVKKIDKLKCNKIKINDFKEYIKKLRDDTGEKSEMKKFYSRLYSFKNDMLEGLIKHVEFNLEEDELIDKIKIKIEEKYVSRKRVDDILQKIIGEFSIWKYDTVKNKGKLILDYEEINSKCTRIFELSRTDKLPIRDYYTPIPSKLTDQTFIKELIEIGDVAQNDTDEIVEYTRYMLKMFNHMKDWEKEGLLGNEDLKRFRKNIKLLWKNSHKYAHENTKEAALDDINKKERKKIDDKCSRKCLANCRSRTLNINNDVLDVDLSNGKFYLLSDQEEIGWKYIWKEKYKIE